MSLSIFALSFLLVEQNSRRLSSSLSSQSLALSLSSSLSLSLCTLAFVFDKTLQLPSADTTGKRAENERRKGRKKAEDTQQSISFFLDLISTKNMASSSSSPYNPPRSPARTRCFCTFTTSRTRLAAQSTPPCRAEQAYQGYSGFRRRVSRRCVKEFAFFPNFSKPLDSLDSTPKTKTQNEKKN